MEPLIGDQRFRGGQARGSGSIAPHEGGWSIAAGEGGTRLFSRVGRFPGGIQNTPSQRQTRALHHAGGKNSRGNRLRLPGGAGEVVR